MYRGLTLAVLVAALAPCGLRAQGTPDAAAVNDALFAETAAVSGLAELTISQIGVQKAVEPELKEFSRQMIEDHTALNQQLTTLAAQKGLALPRTLDARATYSAQSLQGEPREKFDTCYAKAQLVLHMEAVAAFEAEAQRGQDPDVKAMAAKALPKLKSHLKMIKPIADRLCAEEAKAEGQNQAR
jgi:putative membrane protein